MSSRKRSADEPCDMSIHQVSMFYDTQIDKDEITPKYSNFINEKQHKFESSMIIQENDIESGSFDNRFSKS